MMIIEYVECSKCGYNDIPPKMEYKVGRWSPFMQENIITYNKHIEDYILRTCVRCGYKWKEACNDSGENKLRRKYGR